MSWYIQWIYVGVIIYPCSDLDVGLATMLSLFVKDIPRSSVFCCYIKRDDGDYFVVCPMKIDQVNICWKRVLNGHVLPMFVSIVRSCQRGTLRGGSICNAWWYKSVSEMFDWDESADFYNVKNSIKWTYFHTFKQHFEHFNTFEHILTHQVLKCVQSYKVLLV